MQVKIHGLDAKQGEPAFAFLVLRLTRALDRDALVQVVRQLSPMIPDVDGFIEELPEELEEPMQLVGMPWTPPEPGGIEVQRQLVESASARGVEAAWFFQTGTSLPLVDQDEDDDEDDDEDSAGEARGNGVDHDDFMASIASEEDAALANLFGDDLSDEMTSIGAPPLVEPPKAAISADDAWGDDDEEDADADEDEDDDEADDDELDVEWSHGPPPQAANVRFPVDGYPAILEELDWEDFGVAFKLAGDAMPGEGTVLLGFHALWLAPYGGRYRNAAVTIDRKHHAAHLWVDRFAVPSSPEEQVHHLLWVLSKIDEVVPVLHARFGGASMAQKYGGLMGDTSEPFVLGGNPLRALYAAGAPSSPEGSAELIDGWIASHPDWSKEEIAHMLRELAIEVVTSDDDRAASGLERVPDSEVEALYEAAGMAPGQDDEDDDDLEDDDDGDLDDDDEDTEGADTGRQITAHAAALLIARARAGVLDARVAGVLRPVLASDHRHERRRRAIAGVLAALGDRESVPALAQILTERTSIGRDELLRDVATALGTIADPAAVPALSELVAAPSTREGPRAAAADALATCLARAPEPPGLDDNVLDDNVLDALLRSLARSATAELALAYGRLAHQLPTERRELARQRLEDETKPGPPGSLAALARQAALQLARGSALDDSARTELGSLVQTGLRSTTPHDVRVALRVAEALPELVEADDLVPLTRRPDHEVRTRAHAVLERLGRPLSPARLVDRITARELADAEIVKLIAEPHLVGRTAVIAEAGRRDLADAHDAVRAATERALHELDVHAIEAGVRVLRRREDAATAALLDQVRAHPDPRIAQLADAADETDDAAPVN